MEDSSLGYYYSEIDSLIPYKVDDWLECFDYKIDASFFDILEQVSRTDLSLSLIDFYYIDCLDDNFIEIGASIIGSYWSLGECSTIGVGMVSCWLSLGLCAICNYCEVLYEFIMLVLLLLLLFLWALSCYMVVLELRTLYYFLSIRGWTYSIAIGSGLLGAPNVYLFYRFSLPATKSSAACFTHKFIIDC